MRKKIVKPDIQADRIIVFQEKTIRRTWHNEEWWFSVVDVCGVLTESPDAGAYWRKLKQRLGAEGSEAVTFCHGLKLAAPDGNRAPERRTGFQGEPLSRQRRLHHRRQCAGGQKRSARSEWRQLSGTVVNKRNTSAAGERRRCG